MSKIKSALELALERTADVEINQEAVRKEEAVKKGKALAGRFLNEQKNISFQEELKKQGSEEMAWMKEGIMDTLLANLTLPRYENDLDRLPRITEGLKALMDENSKQKLLNTLMTQYESIFKQYLETSSDLTEQLRIQWEPRLKQKEELLQKQTGQTIKLSAEQDPEFTKVLSENFAQLDAQYNEALVQGKNEIRRLL